MQFSSNTCHIVIDMQRLFAEATAWQVPGLAGILPNVSRLCDASGANTVFARFIPPQRAELAPGQWQAYYRRWPMVTGDVAQPDLLDLVAPLAGRAGRVVDKTTYSIFGTAGFADSLFDRNVDTLVFSGVETDVCVYASVLGAVDLGFRVVIVTDAVISADPAAHQATLTHLIPRLPDQIDLATTDEVVKAWVR